MLLKVRSIDVLLIYSSALNFLKWMIYVKHTFAIIEHKGLLHISFKKVGNRVAHPIWVSNVVREVAALPAF